MREGVHLWRRAPRHRKWKMKSKFDFILKNLAELKNCLPYGLLNFFLIWVIVVQRLRSIAWGHPETPSSLVTADQTMPGPLPSTSGACGHTFFSKARRKAQFFSNFHYYSLLKSFTIMRNSQIQTTKPAEQIYQVIIDGIVHRGTRAEIQQIIADDRENRG